MAAPRSESTAGRLLARLERAFGAGEQGPAEIRGLRPLAGGASHETWSFDLVEGGAVEPLVMREDLADALLEAGNGDEFTLLGALHRAGIPVPRPVRRLAADDDGMALIVVTRADGVDLRKVLADESARADAPDLAAVLRMQAEIHALDIDSLDGALPRPTGGVVIGEITRWRRAFDEGHEGEEADPLLHAAFRWLDDHCPPEGQPCLVHGDFKANNLLVADGEIVVLDWEFAHIGDPIEDLAWTMLWQTEWDVVGGLADPPTYVAEYEAATGRTVAPEALRFWELFSLAKLAVIFKLQIRAGLEPPVKPLLLLMGRGGIHLEWELGEKLLELLEVEG